MDRRSPEDDGVGSGYHAARRVLASLAPLTPTTLVPPGYQLLDTLGVGGGGATFLALRDGSDRPVALKVLHAPAAPGAARQRAWRELDLLQDTHLPCLPRLLDYGVVGDRLFIATEFVSGRRLDEHVRAIPRTHQRWNHIAAILARVADAVHSLNERGIIHRDLKPSNILIAAGDEPFIIDLGVAALVSRDAAETLTSDGAPVGTPAFMSPEQARGDRELVSIRSDVYALGATACAVLTGHTPHDLAGVSLHEAVRRVGTEPPREPRTLEASLPKALSAIIAKACAPRPGDRYATAAELAEDFRRFTRREPVLASRPGAWQRVMRWVAQHPRSASATGSIGIAIAVLAGSGLLTYQVMLRPHSFVITQEQREAQLRSPVGVPLRVWRADAAYEVLAGDLVRDRAGDVVYLAGDTGDLAALAGGIGVFDAEDLDRPLWTSAASSAAIQMPPDLALPQDTFRVHHAFAADVFENVPGPELVSIHGLHSGGLQGVRIYSLRTGEVLYEAWHDGSVGRNIVWLPSARVLVLAGVSNPLREAGLRRIPSVDLYPVVVFAIRPELGRFCGWVNRANSTNGLPAPTVLWYRAVSPPEISSRLPLILLNPSTRGGRRDSESQLLLQSRDGAVGFGVFFDAAGLITGRVVSDAYRHERENATPSTPDPVDVSLDDIPGGWVVPAR